MENDPGITPDDARLSLDTVSRITDSANTLVRPPFWLNIVLAISFGMMTFSFASMQHENLWTLGLIIGGIVFVLAMMMYLYTCKLLGAKVKLFPDTWLSLGSILGPAAIYMLVVLGGRALADGAGIAWIPYLAGVVNGTLLSYMLHNHSVMKFQGR